MSVQVKKRLFTVDEYNAMARAGVLGEDDRVELIEGEIVEMTPIGPRHAACVTHLQIGLSEALGARAVVRVQNPVVLHSRSEPEPDIAVVKPRDDLYARQHPGPEDILLIVEVADVSAAYDRHTKARLYARAGIPELWIADLDARKLLVHRQPSPDGYGAIQALAPGDRASPSPFPNVEFDVAKLVG